MAIRVEHQSRFRHHVTIGNTYLLRWQQR